MKTKKKKSQAICGDQVFDIVNSVCLCIVFVITLYPLVYVVSASVSDPVAVSSGKMWLFPVDFSLEGYSYIMKLSDIWLGYRNTILYTVLGTFFNLLFTIPCAYALSRKELIGRNFIMGMFLITMYVNGGLIPNYLNMDSFGLVDTPFALVVGTLVSTFNLIIARTFMANSIPNEIIEAAKIDGCSDFKIFGGIVMPLSKAILVVMALYYGIVHWNNYFNAMIYITNRNYYPLQMFLREILIQSQLASSMIESGGLTTEELVYLMREAEKMDMIKYCVIVVASIPMMVIYPNLQKYFAKGVMIGSVKG